MTTTNIGKVRHQPKNSSEKYWKRYSLAVTFFSLALLLALLFNFNSGNSIKITQDNIQDQLSEIILLPDETPSVAVLEDVEPLKEKIPDFYANARNGDKLVVYSNFAMIFRESEGKIINIIQVDSEQ